MKNKSNKTNISSFDKNILPKLNNILAKVGDLSFKRRVISIIRYLDIQKGDVILDAGCGEGFYSMILSELFDCKIYAIDHDEEILTLASGHLSNKDNVFLSQENIFKLRFKEKFFDKIICTEVIEHLPSEKVALKELYRVLKPKGTAIFTVPSINYPFVWDPLNKVRGWLGLGHFSPYNRILGGVWSWGHYRLYSPRTLAAVLEKAGFKLSTLEVQTRYGLPFNLLILNLGKLFYTRLPVSKDIKNSMEKFEWKKAKSNAAGTKSFISLVIEKVFSLFLWIDAFNNRELDLDEPSMTVLSVVSK